MKEGDIVRIKKDQYGPDYLVGIVVATGQATTRVYGDGYETTDYVDVKWFSDKYKNISRFSPPTVLEVLSTSEEA